MKYSNTNINRKNKISKVEIETTYEKLPTTATDTCQQHNNQKNQMLSTEHNRNIMLSKLETKRKYKIDNKRDRQ